MRWVRVRSQIGHAAILFAPLAAVLVAAAVVSYAKDSSPPLIINHEMKNPIAPVEEPGDNHKRG